MADLRAVLFPSVNEKQIAIIIIVTIIFLIPDSIINTVSDFLISQTTSVWGILFFIILSIVFALSQYFLLGYVWLQTSDIRKKSFLFNGLLKIVIAAQYTLLAILLLIIFQIISMSQYYTALLICTTIISLLLTSSLLGILARQFFLWYQSHKKDSFIIFIYTLAFIIVSTTFSIALILDMYTFSTKQAVVSPSSEVIFPDFDDVNLPMTILHLIYHYSDLISFVLIWGATALLLLHYRKRLGLVKFWILISLPLIYYLSTFVEMIGIYEPESASEEFWFYLYFSLNSTAGGLMFGIAFITMGNKIGNKTIKGYMTLTAYGFIILYISSQISLVMTPYPPFGITTLMLSGLSSYLLLIGLYSTAVSLSQHSQLRKSIRKSMDEQHLRLIDKIGMSEMQREMDKKIAPLIKRFAAHMDNQSAIDLTISDEEIKQYLHEVLREIHEERP